MVYSLVEDTFLLEAYYRNAVNTKSGWTYSMRTCYLQFRNEFPEHQVGTYEVFAQHVRRVVARYNKTGSVVKSKPRRGASVLTEEILDEVREYFRKNPNTSLRQLSAQTGLSYGSCHRAVRKLHLQRRNRVANHELEPTENCTS